MLCLIHLSFESLEYLHFNSMFSIAIHTEDCHDGGKNYVKIPPKLGMNTLLSPGKSTRICHGKFPCNWDGEYMQQQVVLLFSDRALFLLWPINVWPNNDIFTIIIVLLLAVIVTN